MVVSMRTESLLSRESVVVSELAIDLVSGAGKNVLMLIKVAYQLFHSVLVLTSF
jgi:hypothetical protein